MATLPPIVSFWHGPLSYLERICLTSFIEKGHTVELYAYARPDNLPQGVIWREAAEIIPSDEIFYYKGDRTPAVFADLFRLKLLAHGRGIWVDCDVYCVRPFTAFSDYVFGIESEPTWRNFYNAQINNAVLGMPADSALISALLSVFEPGAMPPGLPFWRRIEVGVRRTMGEALPIHYMQFGATGPAPLTHFVRKLGLMKEAQPKDVFYPLDYERAAYLLAAGSTLDSIVTDVTHAVHIWNSALTDRHTRRMRDPEPGSFFDRERKRLDL